MISIKQGIVGIALMAALCGYAQSNIGIQTPITQQPRSGGNTVLPPMPGGVVFPIWHFVNGIYTLDTSLDSMGGMATSVMEFPSLDDGGTNYDGCCTNDFVYSFPTNGLWLRITNVANGHVSGLLHNATNLAYAILGKTNLLAANWGIEQAILPGTNHEAIPFSVATLDRQMLFLQAMDWTGITHNGNITPDWWFWTYFGTTELADTTLDSQGRTMLSDYQSGSDPNVISFSILLTNRIVNSINAPVQLNITAGIANYMAASVDDTNYAANAYWQPGIGTNFAVNLGQNEGWHDVWIGLRGLPANAEQTWQHTRLKLDLTPPLLVITNPVSSTVDVPILQLQGFCREALTSISYDLSNASGIVTNQQVLVVNQDYSTNTAEITASRFQAYDVALTNGVNAFTLRARDLAGNMSVTNFNIVIDYSNKTNPPALQIDWPLDGVAICGTSFTCHGLISDPSATILVQLMDANGNTNVEVNAVVGRDGLFWAQTLPLNGTTTLSITATDAAGNTSATNLTVQPGSIGLTIDPVAAGQTIVTGEIDSDDYTVWVNGAEATNNGDGTWTAQITPICVGGGSVEAIAIPVGSGNMALAGGTMVSASGFAPMSMVTEGSQGAQVDVAPPQGVFISSYHFDQTIQWGWVIRHPDTYHNIAWEDGAGGTGGAGLYMLMYVTDAYTWPATHWPQPLPYGTDLHSGTVVPPRGGTPFCVTNTASAPVLRMAHCDGYRESYGDPSSNDSWTDSYQTEHAEVKLATGGPLGSMDQNLWVITASATDAITGQQIPYDQISIGAFGNLDTNGELYVFLPDNDPDVVTPRVNSKNYYTFTVGAQKYTLSHQTMHSALTNTNRSRTTIGVGEEVTLGGMPIMAKWKTSAGSLSVLTGASTTFTAPSNSANAIITVSVGAASKSITFSVVEPQGVDHADIFELTDFNDGSMGAGMRLHVFIAPTSVSFYKVQCLEVGENATNKTGYYATNAAPSHTTNGANQWLQLNDNNIWDDLAQLGPLDCPPLGMSGGFSWNIPAKWKLGSGQTHSMKGWDQVFSVDAVGTVSVRKFNHIVIRKRFDVFGDGY